MENNQDKYETSVISDTSTVLLDISKLEFKLDKLEALANAQSSDIESDIDINISDMSDDDKLDLGKVEVATKRPIKNVNQNDDKVKTKRYSRYINYDILTPARTPENEKTSISQRQVIIENENKARGVNFVNQNAFSEISANPRGLDESINTTEKSIQSLINRSTSEDVKQELEIMKQECINRENDLRRLKEELETLKKDSKIKDNKLRKLEAEKSNLESDLVLYKEKSNKLEKSMHRLSDVSRLSDSSRSEVYTLRDEIRSLDGKLTNDIQRVKYLERRTQDPNARKLVEQLERYQAKFRELKKVNDEERNKSREYKARFVEIKKLINQLEEKQKEDKKAYRLLKRTSEQEIINYKSLLQTEQERSKELEAKLKELKNTQTVYEIEKIKEIERLTLQIKQIEIKSKEYVTLIQKEKKDSKF